MPPIEYKIIDGVMHSRHYYPDLAPNVGWKPCSPEKLTAMALEAERGRKAAESELRRLQTIIDNLEDDIR
jgi:hypothetical protein